MTRKTTTLQPALHAIRDAQRLLRAHFPITRLIEAPSLSALTDGRVSLKMETDLPTGSFKVRGAMYALATHLQRRAIREVVASSTGNHGAAVAYAAKLLGLRAKIFLPAGCNRVKRDRIAALGADIVEKGNDGADAFALASEWCAQAPDSFFLNDATDPDLPAGPGVIGLEILEQNPSVQMIVVPMGDTALIRGVGAAAKQVSPRVKIVGVQAERAPSYYLSWKSGQATPTDSCNTFPDGLATRTPEAANVTAIREIVDDIVLVSEEAMLKAIRILLLQEHVVAEPAGAASTAALLKKPPADEKDVVLVVSGLNVSPEVLRQAVVSA